jgi:opacity protein-like surface antigen
MRFGVSFGRAHNCVRMTGGNVDRLLKAFLMGAVIAGGLGAVALAADQPDPVIGKWTLNVAKSAFVPGPAPKSQTRTYADSAQGTVMKFTGVSASGAAVSGGSTYKYDGKDYPVTGSPDFDTLAPKRLNGSTVRIDLKKGGKVVGTTIRTLSVHNKVLTLSSKGKDSKGATFDNIMVFDKQP